MLSRVAAQARPCRNARPALSLVWPSALLSRPPRPLLRAVSQPPRPCHVHSRSYSGRVPGRIAACLAIQPSSQATLLSRYAHSYRNTIPQQPGPRARAARPCARASRVVAQLRSVVAPFLAVSWPSLPCHARLPNLPVTIQCIVS